MRQASVFSLLVGISLAFSASAATLVVDRNGGADYADIQSAIDAAVTGDTVLVKPGEYVIARPIDFNRLRWSQPLKEIVVRSEAGAQVTVIRMSDVLVDEGYASVVAFSSQETPASVLDGFTLTGGRGCRDRSAPSDRFRRGGGVLIEGGAQPSLRNCIIVRNSAEYGGGVCVLSATCWLTDCTIRENFAWGGGGIFASQASLRRCSVLGNVAHGWSGGLFANIAEVTSCIIWGNAGPAIEYYTSPAGLSVTYSCIEGESVWPGTGNTNSAPRFRGWAEAPEVTVADQSAFETALTEFSSDLAQDSPCLGTGHDGENMGAPVPTCPAAGAQTRLIRMSGGSFFMMGMVATGDVSLVGAGKEATTIEGTVAGLRSGCTLSDVRVTGGLLGGVVVGCDQSPRITNVDAVQNSSLWGGGLLCGCGSGPVVSNCSIRKNSVQGGGGGVYCGSDCSPVFENCVIAENQDLGPGFYRPDLRSGGGGIHCRECTSASFTNCFIQDNASRSGGGVYSYDSSMTFVNCTIAGNMAANEGGGLYCLKAAGPAVIELRSCITWNNFGGAIASAGNPTMRITWSCTEGTLLWPGVGNTNVDPQFCAWPTSEVWVDAGHPAPGNGTPEDPYSTIKAAVSGYRLSLREGSPCRGTGEGGKDMGAEAGACEAVGSRSRLLHLGPGTYPIQGSTLANQVSIEGAGRELTVIEGTVYGLRTGSVLSGVRVTKGSYAGIVVSMGQAPVIRDCTFSENSIHGMKCVGANPMLSNCMISGNDESGLYCSEASPTLIDCTISENHAGDGGGVYCTESSPTLVRCAISRNSASRGGGVYCSHSSPTLIDCSIFGNWASSRDGGGIYCLYSSPMLTNCILVGNGAGNNGGGIVCGEASRLINCTISGNVARYSGGGVYCSLFARSTLTNCIVWGNTGAQIYYVTEEAKPVVVYSCIEGDPLWLGEGNINGDPVFVGTGAWEECATWREPGCMPYQWDAQGNGLAWHRWIEGDYHLRLDSPCIDAGTHEVALTTDIEGHGRPCGNGMDIGAYEVGDCEVPTLFLRGDANHDSRVDLSDAIGVLLQIFNAHPFSCMDASDANDSGAVDIADAVAILSHLFAGAGPLPGPFAACGIDPSSDALGCVRFAPCE